MSDTPRTDVALALLKKTKTERELLVAIDAMIQQFALCERELNAANIRIDKLIQKDPEQ